MARKRRTVETAVPVAGDKKVTPRYEDQFQRSVGGTIEDAGKRLEGQGRNILYGLGALAVLGLVVWFFYVYSSRENAKAQAALGKAITISQSQITDTPPAGSTQKTFKTERERAEASIAEFQKVASEHGGDVGAKAKYFAAVNRLSIDRPAGISELEPLAKERGDIGVLSKYALANAIAADGRTDEALALYQDLAGTSDAVVSKDSINIEIARIYEKQGKKQEAADILFNIVKTASEAKDFEGKPVTLSPTAQSAKDKLAILDPERAKQIPEPALGAPDAAGMPFGN